MNILIDPQIFRYGYCGMTRYYAFIIELLESAGHRIELPLLYADQSYVRGLIGLPEVFAGSWFGKRLQSFSTNYSRRLYYRKLRTTKPDLVILTSPTFEDRFLKYIGDTPFLMVVHDTMRSLLIPHSYLDSHNDNLLRLIYLAQRAKSILCISEWTQKDLLGCAPIDREKVTTVHSCCFLNSIPDDSSLKNLPEKFLLFVGVRSERKNFNFIIQSLAESFKEFPDLRIVCTGKFSRWERDYIESLGLSERVLDVGADDVQLATLYWKARGLIFPSLYEGFGLPILEAMTYDCPVITSNVSVLPEVAGDAALMVDPYDAESIRDAVWRVWTDQKLCEELIRRGRDRVKEFSRERMQNGLERCIEVAVK